MTIKLSATFSLNQHTAVPAPHVRLWIDVNGSGVLSDEEEVSLRQSGLEWKGDIETELASTDGMIFTLKYIASSLATAKLKIESDTPSSHVVLDSSRTVQNVQGFIVGLLGA